MAITEKYVDGFVLMVRKTNSAYKENGIRGCTNVEEIRCRRYKECVADDMNAPWALPFRP